MTRTLRVADLFCGAGGTSLGVARACEAVDLEVDLVAVNHWPRAVSTHELNHPWARHFCARVESLDPKRVFPEGEVDLIVAGVECTHHSRARGGKPMNDQSRASAWHVAHWAEQLRAREILIENVPEFQFWGALDENNRPIKARRGETFRAFIAALESLGYCVEHRILTCADYGDPTTRRRLFLRASLNADSIDWPDQTHAEDCEQQPWKTAREIIDWSDLGSSIFTRKRPLADRTIARIRAGIEKFGGEYAEPFLLMLTHGGRLHSLDKPLPTVTGANRGEIGLATPYLVKYYGTATTAPVQKPMPTVVAGEHLALATPFVLPHDQFAKRNGVDGLVDSIERPVRTIGASNGGDNYLVSPFLVPHFGERPGQEPRTHSILDPVPTVTGTKGAGSLVSPFAATTEDGCALDIYFRMLKPLELARAQGFPDEFQFAGNKGEVVKQIGNAVPPGTAEALAGAIIEQRGWGEIAA